MRLRIWFDFGGQNLSMVQGFGLQANRKLKPKTQKSVPEDGLPLIYDFRYNDRLHGKTHLQSHSY